MAEIEIREMDEKTEYFVSTCSHVNESDELDAAGRRRLAWLRVMEPKGLQALTALSDGEPIAGPPLRASIRPAPGGRLAGT